MIELIHEEREIHNMVHDMNILKIKEILHNWLKYF